MPGSGSYPSGCVPQDRRAPAHQPAPVEQTEQQEDETEHDQGAADGKRDPGGEAQRWLGGRENRRQAGGVHGARQQVLRNRESGESRGQRREARDGQIEPVAASTSEQVFQGLRCH